MKNRQDEEIRSDVIIGSVGSSAESSHDEIKTLVIVFGPDFPVFCPLGNHHWVVLCMYVSFNTGELHNVFPFSAIRTLHAVNNGVTNGASQERTHWSPKTIYLSHCKDGLKVPVRKELVRLQRQCNCNASHCNDETNGASEEGTRWSNKDSVTVTHLTVTMRLKVPVRKEHVGLQRQCKFTITMGLKVPGGTNSLTCLVYKEKVTHSTVGLVKKAKL
jgi:hypothetical protein